MRIKILYVASLLRNAISQRVNDAVAGPRYGIAMLDCSGPGQEEWAAFRNPLTAILDQIEQHPNPPISGDPSWYGLEYGTAEWQRQRLASARRGARKLSRDVRAFRDGGQRTFGIDFIGSLGDIRAAAEKIVWKYMNLTTDDPLIDLPPAAASFYHSCWYPIGGSDITERIGFVPEGDTPPLFDQQNEGYCLYGHIAALFYLAVQTDRQLQEQLMYRIVKLLHQSLCLDFMESSAWPITFLDVWDFIGGRFNYPDIRVLLSGWEFGQMSQAAQDTTSQEYPIDRPWHIIDLSNHAALGREVVSFWRDVFGEQSSMDSIGTFFQKLIEILSSFLREIRQNFITNHVFR